MANTLAASASMRKIPPGLMTWLPVLLGLLVVYFPVYQELAHSTWNQDDYAHGPLILLIAAYLGWLKRSALAAEVARPAPLLGWPVLIFGLLMVALGRSQEIVVLETASHIPVLFGILLVTQGVGAVRAMWFPLFFLIFMIPLPGFLVDAATGPLKQHVSVVAENILYALGYPIARNGVILTVGPYQMLVADACSGLHSMFSLSALGLLYIHMQQNPGWLRNGILLASILPIAFAANAMRVMVLVLVTYHFGDEAGQGIVHDSAGILLFAAALLMLFLLNGLLGLLFSPPRPASR